MLPYTHNPDFVGRGDILEQLQIELVITAEHQPRAVLWGLGGVGSEHSIISHKLLTQLTGSRKSQIAIQYAYWHRKTHPDRSVFWIHAGSVDRFQQGFSEIARECKILGFDDPKADY